MDERKGVLTPDQENILERVVVLKSKAGEIFDGPAIKIIDNQAIEALKSKLKPEQLAIVYQIVDVLFEGLEALVPAQQ